MNLSGRGDKDVLSVQKALDAAGADADDVATRRNASIGCRRRGRGGLVAYVTAGDPDPDAIGADSRRASLAAARTSSRSACRSRIRSPMAR